VTRLFRAAEERVQDCCDAVAALGDAVPAGLLESFQLSLAGLSHFNHKVSSNVFVSACKAQARGSCATTDHRFSCKLRLAWHGTPHSILLTQVLYLDVVPDGGAETLQHLARHVREHLSAGGVHLDQGRGSFTPHVTVAKLSAMAGRGHGSMRKIPEVTK
jgi:2'-5' RNA ligase